MKKILIVLSLLLSIILTGCNDSQLGCVDGDCYFANKAYVIEFQLKGDDNIQLPLNGVYDEKGVMILVDDNDISNDVVIEGEVDTTSPGKYTLEYLITVNDKVYSKTRTVEVLEKSFIDFYLLGSTEIILEYGEKYVEDGYVAIKNYTEENLYLDVSVKGKVDSRTAGIYVLIYELEYYSYKMELERTVIVKDYNNFDFELKNGDKVRVFLGEDYTDDGVLVAYDNLDRIDYNDKLTITSNVNMDIPGTYNVIYSVVVHNVLHEIVRVVEVVDDVMAFVVNGDEVAYHALGETFIDLGCTFYLNGKLYKEAPFNLAYMVDVNTPGIYTIEYSGTLYSEYNDSLIKYDYYAIRTVVVS